MTYLLLLLVVSRVGIQEVMTKTPECLFETVFTLAPAISWHMQVFRKRYLARRAIQIQIPKNDCTRQLTRVLSPRGTRFFAASLLLVDNVMRTLMSVIC
jgi:hypothetical protein